MKLSPSLGFLRLFAGANLRLIGRLLTDQGRSTGAATPSRWA
jgi:hypothetical protein